MGLGFGLVMVLAVAGCGDDGAALGSDSGSDSGADIVSDSGSDSVSDTRSDSSTGTVADTAVADTSVADTTTADTSVADTTTADTAVEETAPEDTSSDEDTAVADTEADTAIASDVPSDVTPDPCEAVDCGNHGSCDDSGGAAVCVCATGYAGPACAACAAGYIDPDGDGTCLASECGDGFVDGARGEDCDPGDEDGLFCDDDCHLDCGEATTTGVEVLLTTGCYAGFDDNLTWSEAQAACAGLGMHMLDIGSAWEQDALVTADQIITWLGLQGTQAEGLDATWESGEPVGYAQATLGLADPYCVGLFFIAWGAQTCDSKLRYVCELTTCGDGVVQSNEECDDGNPDDGDGCDANCTVSGCGNGIQDPSEDCEPGGDAPCPEGCVFRCGHGSGATEVVETSIGCYLLYGTPAPFFGARDACATVGAPLARVDDPIDASTLSELWVPRYGNLWIGLDDNATEGTWVWADGTPLGDARWTAGEPNGTPGANDEDCAELLGTGLWNDGRCTSAHRYVCLARTCGNSAPDGGEECDDGNAIDGDGCDTNCRVSGCGNGVVAGDEACDDANEVDGDGCESDCSFVCGEAPGQDRAWLGADGQCYLAFTDGLPFVDATASCTAIGGWLVDIDDEAENQLVASFEVPETWIGFSDLATEGTWLWESGSTSTYLHWGDGEPNNSADEDCANLRADGRWNDASCAGARSYVCELPL